MPYDQGHPLSRRTVLRGAGLAAAGLAATALAACTTSPSTPAGPAAPSTEAGTPVNPSSRSRVLLAYFSRPGENYWYGDRRTLETGNTEVLAGMISDRVDCDVYRIEAADPYSDAYDPTVARNSEEQDANARPTIAGALPDLAQYDTVLLGSPIWNVQPPMIMATFVEAIDLTDKDVHPFVTYAVSGLGSTARFYRDLDTGARLGDGLAVQGEEVTDAATDVDQWLSTAGLA